MDRVLRIILAPKSVGKQLVKQAFRAIQPQMARGRSYISHLDHALIVTFCLRLHITQSFDCIKNNRTSLQYHKLPEKVLAT
jgi:hypothetical protein